MPSPATGRSVRAVGPLTLMAHEAAGAEGAHHAGFEAAIAVAVTQPEGSPVYAVDWLHEGMGQVMVTGWRLFPAAMNRSPEEWLQHLKSNDRDAYARAAASLASLVADRWGVNWPQQYPRKPAELTPEGALQWVTGSPDLATGLNYWEARAWHMTPKDHNGRVGPFQITPLTAADISPLRVTPKLTALPKGPGPNDNYSPHRYDIRARYDPQTRLVHGTQTLTWQNGEFIPVGTLYFHLWANAEQFAMLDGYIKVTSVTVDGAPAAYQARGLDLVVPLGRPVPHGGNVAVTMAFTTRLPGVISARDFGQEGDRFNLAHWYPSLAVLDDRGWVLNALRTRNAEPYAETAQYKVTLDVPAGTVVGATGRQTARREEGDRWVYEYDAPNFRDWVATGGQGLTVKTLEVEGTTVHFIEKDTSWFPLVMEHVERGLKFFNRRLGKYPYPDLVVSCCVGMEWPGLFFTEPLRSTSERDMQRFLYVVYHELGHQWFYGIVGNDQYNEPWLDEGFTTYADRALFREFGWTPYGGENFADRPFQIDRITTGQDEIARLNQGMGHIYFGGARVLEQLERELGAPLMEELIREWVRTRQFKTATTAEFIAHAEAVSGRDLKAFFKKWGVYPQDRGNYRPILPLGQALP